MSETTQIAKTIDLPGGIAWKSRATQLVENSTDYMWLHAVVNMDGIECDIYAMERDHAVECNMGTWNGPINDEYRKVWVRVEVEEGAEHGEAQIGLYRYVVFVLPVALVEARVVDDAPRGIAQVVIDKLNWLAIGDSFGAPSDSVLSATIDICGVSLHVRALEMVLQNDIWNLAYPTKAAQEDFNGIDILSRPDAPYEVARIIDGRHYTVYAYPFCR